MTTSGSGRRARLLRAASAYGVPVAGEAVCRGHSAPLDFLAMWVYDRPPLSAVLGPRGGGKSYLAALATHMESQLYDFHGTKVLGGSLSQSQQIYGALRDFDRARPGAFGAFTKTQAVYRETGSEVSILAASPTSVRGPHVPTLRLDEVDEIDDDVREAAAGMCMAKGGVGASVSMTSTWHNVAGPMGRLREQAGDPARGFPWHTFCAFEVLERCPDSRSGPGLEHCPSCPIVRWCHADGPPKAKRSSGHYAIDALVQKAAFVSPRAFESDYLCTGPRAAGVWFTGFDPARHVTEAAEYDPRRPVVLSVDPGVFTGAVFFQVAPSPAGSHAVNVFADYLSENVPAGSDARALLDLARARCNGRLDKVVTDPSGASRTAVGVTVEGEYLRAGLAGRGGRLEHWPNHGGSVRASLDLVEALLGAADGTVSLSVHPRCTQLITAFGNYRRAKRGGQWQDYPEEVHPFEDLIDPLRSGLLNEFPEGRKPPPNLPRAPARRVF